MDEEEIQQLTVVFTSAVEEIKVGLQSQTDTVIIEHTSPLQLHINLKKNDYKVREKTLIFMK